MTGVTVVGAGGAGVTVETMVTGGTGTTVVVT